MNRKVRPEINPGNDNRVFVKIPLHCSRTDMPAQGEQKEMFLVLENHSRIAEVDSKASQSYTEFKKRSQPKLFC